MSQFSYEQYQSAVSQAEANGDGAKVGYFKLKDDGDIAIARINIGSTDELDFAAVHTLNVNGRWMKVSCLNPLGTNANGCSLCAAHNANPKGAISKPAKKVYIPMLVSYRDPNAATGYTTPAPVIWERPAAFSRELANKLMIAGNLRNTLVLITRNGKAGDMQTTYSMDILPADHPVFKADMIPADFKAFNNFNIARHSYWDKTAEEINTYLTTGQFPEGNSATSNTVGSTATTTSYAPNPTVPVTDKVPEAPVAYGYGMTSATPTAPPAPMPPSVSPEVTSTPPTRNFSGFSF